MVKKPRNPHFSAINFVVLSKTRLKKEYSYPSTEAKVKPLFFPSFRIEASS
jgi:hypothetical protein